MGKYDVLAITCLITLMFTCAVCQEDICSFKAGGSANNFTIGILQSSAWSPDGACKCSIRPAASGRKVIYYDLSLSLNFVDPNKKAGTDDCDPMVMIMFAGGSRAQDRSEDFTICPTMRGHVHRSTVAVFPGQEVIVHIDNPDKDSLESLFSISGDSMNGMTVECSQAEGVIYETCPCHGAGWGMGQAEPATFDERRRLAIGLSVAFIFLLLVAIIIVGVIFYRRRKAQKKAIGKEAVTVENKAYEGSRQSVNERQPPPEKEARINYSPDPTLNLELQKGGKTHHGSRDSGLASSNEPSNDKRLAFMQPNPASSSLDNLTQMPGNYPPLAGGGSQSSLDRPHQVEPIYTTRPRQQGPNPGPRAGNPDFNPPLAGHGSQGSLNHPNVYPGEDVVYAKLNKPARAGSHDQLYAARAEEEKYHSAESLNASRVTIETDV